MGDKFIYVTYIRTTAEKLWDALRLPEFTRQYWVGTHQACNWEVGAAWALVFADGTFADRGEVLEIDPMRRLVLSWRNELIPEFNAEGFSRATFTIEPMEDKVKLTVTHEIHVKESALIKGVSNGWPLILSSLKTLLETGAALPGTNSRDR